jgi:hypothetical protein
MRLVIKINFEKSNWYTSFLEVVDDTNRWLVPQYYLLTAWSPRMRESRSSSTPFIRFNCKTKTTTTTFTYFLFIIAEKTQLPYHWLPSQLKTLQYTNPIVTFLNAMKRKEKYSTIRCQWGFRNGPDSYINIFTLHGLIIQKPLKTTNIII